MIQLIEDSLAELNPPAPPATGTKRARASPSPPPAPVEKWSRENHPAFKKTGADEDSAQAVEVPITYQVNDTVMAKWVSGDKGFYPARITSVTGSSTAPIYTVKFKSYDTVETLRSKDIRPVAAQKRKADGTSVTAAIGAGGGSAASTTAESGSGGGASSPSNNGIVMSAGAELYPHAKRDKEKEKLDDNGRPKFKKIKAKKELEAGKNKWQEFNAKGKASKGAKKDSMFRTPEGIRGRGEFSLPVVCGVLF